MRRLTAFESVSADGYFADKNGGLDWAHSNSNDPEFQEFVSGNAKDGGTLVMGRKTYQMMEKYWPTPEAKKNDPVVADGMNNAEKIVFSTTLKNPSWSNTRVESDDIAGTIREEKRKSGPDMAILGSGSVVSQLAKERLIDEFTLVVVPVVLGDGRKLFDVNDELSLELKNSRTFKNGNVVLTYEPKKAD